MPIVHLPTVWVVILDCVAWATIHLSAAYLTYRMSAERFSHNTLLYQERRWEQGGRLYAGALRAKRWKYLLPDGAAAIKSGFRKRHLASRDVEYLIKFLAETRRAELTHWIAMLPVPIFLVWNPVPVAFFMVVYALAANLPCIIAQRYNRIRLDRVSTAMRDRGKRGKNASAAGV